MIREATSADVPAIVAMGTRFHTLSPFAFIPVDTPSLTASIAGLVADENAAVLVDEGLTGMLGVTAHPVMMNAAVKVAQEAFWWSEGDAGLALLQAAKAWAGAKGCAGFFTGAIENDRIALMARLYRMSGFTPVERFFLARL